MKSRSDYDYFFKDEKKTLCIVDLNLGRMSVTNNAENVINEIKKEVGDKIYEMKIIYQDSENAWDTIIPIWENNECVNVNFKFGI